MAIWVIITEAQMCSREISWLRSSTWKFYMCRTMKLQWNCAKSHSFFSGLFLRKPQCHTYVKRNYKHLWAVTHPFRLPSHTSGLFQVFSWSHRWPRSYRVGFKKCCRKRKWCVLWIPCFQLLWKLTGSFLQLVMLKASSFICCCSSFCQSKQLMLMGVGGSLPH